MRVSVEADTSTPVGALDAVITDFCEANQDEFDDKMAMVLVRQEIQRAGAAARKPTRAGIARFVDYLAQAESEFRDAASVAANRDRRLRWAQGPTTSSKGLRTSASYIVHKIDSNHGAHARPRDRPSRLQSMVEGPPPHRLQGTGGLRLAAEVPAPAVHALAARVAAGWEDDAPPEGRARHHPGGHGPPADRLLLLRRVSRARTARPGGGDRGGERPPGGGR